MLYYAATSYENSCKTLNKQDWYLHCNWDLPATFNNYSVYKLKSCDFLQCKKNYNAV